MPAARLLHPFLQSAAGQSVVTALVRAWSSAVGHLDTREGESVLDVGCGKGELAHDIAQRARARMTGIDFNPGSLAFARARFDDAELGLPHYSDPTHETEYTWEDLEAELHAAGLRLSEVEQRWGELWVVADA